MGRLDVEAHLVALRHPGREEQDGTRRRLENCLGNLNAPCDLISKRGRVDIKLQQEEAKIPQPPSLFFLSALSDLRFGPIKMVFEMCIWGQLSIHRLISIAFPFQLSVTLRGLICKPFPKYIIIPDHMSCP